MPPGVVDEDVAVVQQVGQLLDRGVEISIPAVVVDVVVGLAEGVDRLARPVVVGHALPARRPGEGAAAARRRMDRGRHRPMQLDQRRHVLRTVAGPAAIGGDAEIVDEALGGDDPGPGAQLTVRWMEQPEVQPRLGAERELGQGLEEPQVDAVARDREMDPVEGTAEAERERVGHVDERLGVVRPVSVVRLVTVTEVVPELHARWDAPTQAHQPLDDARSWVTEPHGHDFVEHRELEVRVPLDRELVVRDGVEDPGQFVEHPLLVERLDAGLVLRRDECGDRRQWRGQRDLEPAMRGDLPVPLAASEDAVRRDRGLGIAQVVEAQRVERLAVAHPQARQSPMGLVARRADLELGAGAQTRGTATRSSPTAGRSRRRGAA